MISVSIIGHNEENNIKRCMESAKWADEIVFIDCGSTDRTAEISAGYTKNIFKKENNVNLNVNKQFGIDQCRNEWVLYIDPDEVITEGLKNEILSVVGKSSASYGGYLIPRKNYYFGKFLGFGGKYPDYQLRLFRKNSGRFRCESVHERISVNGKIGALKNPMLHYPYMNVSDMLKKSNFYTSRKAELLFSKKKRPGCRLLVPLLKFIENYIFKFGFLDGITGFKVCIMDSYNEFVTLLKLKEIYDEK